MKKFYARVLLIAFLLSLVTVPIPAKAADAWDGSVDISWYDPDKSEFYIDTPAQLAGLAALVNGMTDPDCPKVTGEASYIKSVAYPDTLLVGAGGGNVSDTVYGSETDFAYKTVYLTADMDMGATAQNGNWQGPNWTPIGGKFPMKPTVTSGDCLVLDTRFNGVLDGQGHTVKNIYCDRYSAKGFPYSMAVGLVGFLGGSDDHTITGKFTDGWQPAVKNVIVGDGYIYARRMVGGVVGRVGETTNGIIIENCANYADVHNTDSKGIGGIVGAGWGSGVIRNCYNVGPVTTTYVCPAGGICGSNSGLSIYNCYNTGKIDSNNQKRGRGIGGHDSGVYTVENSYYLEGCDDDPESGGWYTGNSKRITVNVKALTAEKMKSQEFIDMLNASGTVFAADSGKNNGYPVLYFENSGGAGANYDVTVMQPSEGGSISADLTGSVPSGKTVSLTAKPESGWILKHFTLNGKPLSGAFFTVSGDSAAGAVFVKVRKVSVTLPQLADSYLSFTKTEISGDDMQYIERAPVKNGDTLLEGDIITINAVPYKNAVPADMNMQFTGVYETTAVNAEKNTDGTFTVTGDGNVTFTVKQTVTKKSWLSLADTSWYTGAADSYILTNAYQLAGMAYLVNAEGVDFSGVTINLGCDISLANNDGTQGTRIWEACGKNASRAFAGIFDGCGFSIFNMNAHSDGSYAGLFGYTSGAVIRNVTLRGTVTCTSPSSYAGSVAAYASNSVIENCVNRAEIKADGTNAGGIAAYIVDGTVVKNSQNRAAVKGLSGVGGIAGISYSSEDLLENCQNYGSVTSTGDGGLGTGGVAGQLAGVMKSCGNFAAVSGFDRYIGGIAGYTTSRVASKITDSVSTGSVSSDCTNKTAAVGAVIGWAQFASLENVSGTGAISVSADFSSPGKGGDIGSSGVVTNGGASNVSALPESIPDTDTWKEPAQTEPQRVNENYTRPVYVRAGGTITQNGTYTIEPSAAGVLRIADNLTVTLTGSGTDLSINTGAGVNLTLDGVSLTGSKTLLTMNGGSLTLTGDNTLAGLSDTKDNAEPTAAIAGQFELGGGGTLFIGAGAGNSCVKLAENTVFSQKGGTLLLSKDGLLGGEGGAFHAPGAEVTISGGVFAGDTNSDNVSVIHAKDIKIAGGVVRAQALKSPSALEAEMVTITGGKISLYGHSGNSASAQREYNGLDAVKGSAENSGGVFENILPFDDVLVSARFYEDVQNAYSAGYFTGVSAKSFAPASPMTRAMFVTVLYRIAGSPVVTAGTQFTDLTQDWYKNAVAWAVSCGITGGTSDSKFSPDEDVTLEQAAVFLMRYQKLTGKQAEPVNGANGAGTSPWARAAVAWAVESGLLPQERGFSEPATRAELSSAVSRLLKI